MAELKDISLLIIDDSIEEISRISSVLDNSGFRVRSHKAEVEDELIEQINTSHPDIILVKHDSEPLSPKVLLQTLNKLDKDIPVLVISQSLSGKETAQFIRMGAKDVVADEEDQHMVAVVSREMENRMARAHHRNVLRKLSASENRYQQLMEYSNLPMAIVQESMFVLVNEAFIELFELDADEIDALPAIEVLDANARQSFKKLYKKYVQAPESFGTEEIQTIFTNSLGESNDITIDVHNVKYNDEDSLQFIVEPQTVEATGDHFTDPTGAMPRHRLIQFIDNCISLSISDAPEESKDSCLACISIDGYQSIQDTLGIGLTDELYGAFQLFVSEYFPDNPLCAFDTNKLLVLFEGIPSDKTLKLANEFCKAVDDHLFEFAENSQQLTCTTGVALISELVTSSDTVIKRSFKACEQILKAANGEVGNSAALYEPEASEESEEAIDVNYLIKQAFKHNHLEPLFQPMLNFHGDSGKHYEVLLGVLPKHEDTYPSDFIAMATRTNENHEIDKWVILESLRTLIKKENCDGDESLYIHLSKQSLRSAKFVPWLAAAIKKSKVKPDRLAFQLREPDVLPNLKAAVEMSKQIAALGCKMVITNFGSSVQPMKILESIKFDYAKVDTSFALSAQSSADGAQVLTRLLDQISSAGIPAIIPCIESAAILPVLWKSNVAYIQGYYVQAPSPIMDYAP